MARHANGSQSSYRCSPRVEAPSVESQADAWALQARDFALQTHALRKMHPGKGPLKKLLFLLQRSINTTLKE